MRKPVFRGWFVLAACFLCMLISGGIGWFAFPVFIPPLKQEFGWTDLELGLAVGIWAGVGALFSPVAGRLVDRFGSRWIMLAGAGGGGLVTLAFGEIRTLGQLYGVIFFAAIFTAAGTYVAVTSTISRWFVRRRGLAMSIGEHRNGRDGTRRILDTKPVELLDSDRGLALVLPDLRDHDLGRPAAGDRPLDTRSSVGRWTHGRR
jgi:hypothetical protein